MKHKGKLNRKTMFLLSLFAILIVILGVGFYAYRNEDAKIPMVSQVVKNFKGKSYTAEEIITKMKEDQELPIDKVIVYDEKTDVNELLGKEGQYTSKINFSDTTALQIGGDDNPVGGTIEVFKNSKDAKARCAYIEAYTKALPIIQQYMYREGKYLLRIDKDIEKGLEEKYEKKFLKIVQ